MQGLIDDLPEVSLPNCGFLGLCIKACKFVMAFSEIRFGGLDSWNLDPTISKQPESLQLVLSKMFFNNPNIFLPKYSDL